MQMHMHVCMPYAQAALAENQQQYEGISADLRQKCGEAAQLTEINLDGQGKSKKKARR